MMKIMKLVVFEAALILPVCGWVCQLLTEADEPLQDSLGFECQVTAANICNCSTSFIKGASWQFVNAQMNASMFYGAKPGQWYLMDKSKQCVASFNGMIPTVQTCPPGFYCLGGLEPPRSCNGGEHCPGNTGDEPRACPKNYFCPIPAGNVQPCPAGGHCPGGTTQPQACMAGHYCRFGQEGKCPKGHFCPFGTENPRECSIFTSCPEGSKVPNRWLFSLVIVLAVIGFAVLGCIYYQRMVEHGLFLCALLAVCIGLMWFVDKAIALFLSLIFLSVAANWALLKMGQVSPAVASGLVSATAMVAVLLLWLVHPPWAAFMLGLLICCTIGYLMSRQELVSVVCGRICMILFLVFLIFEYSQVDPDFTLAFGVLFLCLFVGIMLSYVRPPL